MKGSIVGFGLTGVGTVWTLENEFTVLSTALQAGPQTGATPTLPVMTRLEPW